MFQFEELRKKTGCFGRSWPRALLLLSPIVLAYGALLGLEGVAISWIDGWLPVSSFESATRSALFVSAGLMWCRLCLIGVGVWLVLKGGGSRRHCVGQFALTWALGSALVAGAMLAVDLWQHVLQYGEGGYSGETVRSILLLLVYFKILLVYPGVRLLFGALQQEEGKYIVASWGAVSLIESIKLYFVLLLLKLAIESVLVTAISYLPFVAPFWFIPDELSRLRFFVGQGIRIVAESVGVLLYIAIFVAVAHSLVSAARRQSR